LIGNMVVSGAAQATTEKIMELVGKFFFSIDNKT